MSPTPIFAAGKPPSRFKMVYFLYDKLNLKETWAVDELVKIPFPHVRFFGLPIHIGNLVEWGERTRPFIVSDSLMVGIGEMGTIAAYLQGYFPDLNLSVIVINSPTDFQQIELKKHPNRVALYSSHYPPIQGRCDWKDLADISFDVEWLQHGILSESGGNLCKYSIANLIIQYIRKPDITMQRAGDDAI